ncbi:putative ribonuclease H-like domain-containing protein, partial [Tanacetum coccineum]
MKMEYWIMNSDHNLWTIVLNGNSRKKTGRDPKGNIMILPPIFVEEHIAVQRETKARTILLQSLPEDHMADFHHLDDARDIWLAVKARFGGNDESKKMRKSMLKQEFSEFRMQANPDNEDCNMKFLRALPPSWSQVAITLKTKGGLDYLSFDDLYNKLRTLEIDVKGGSSYDSRGTSAPTHSAFISAASTNSKMSYADSQNQSPSITFTTASSSADTSSNVIESVLHSFVAESDPQQQITYEDFDQIRKLDLEELDIKWQMAMLSVRINRFEKKARRKMKFNNRDAARFDKKKVKCYKCSELGHFARECTWKQLDSKARYSAFKLKELDKSEEPKALLSVDSMLNWSDHEGEDEEKGAAQVYGMIAGDDDDAAGDASGDVSDAAAEFALMGLSSQVCQSCWECCCSFTFKGTFMTPSTKTRHDLDDTQVTYGSKSNDYFETNSVSNDYVSCDNSDKSSDSETTGFASCVSSVKSSSSKTNEHLAFSPNSVAFQTMSETAVQQPSSTNDDSSFSFKENVKPPINLCNKSGIDSRSFCKRKSFGSKTCFVCDSKFHLIKDCDFYEKQLELHNKPLWNNVTHIPSFVPEAASVPAGSRHRPTSIPTGRPFSAGWKNNAARPMTRPTSHYFQHFSRPGYSNHMDINKGRWGTAENPHKNRDLGIVDSGCSRSMTGNKEKLVDFVKIVGGTVTFGGGDGKITGKGTIRTSKLDFENVYYVEELQTFNLFSVSQICDTKNKVLFTDKECLVLSKEFQLPDNSQVVLRVPRRNNLYCFNLTDIKPERDVTCLLAKASLVESTKWHRRMAHVNFKNMNKLAKHGLVNGLPSKLFTNEHNCVACNKGKQHKASYKAITAVSTISAPLQLLHMDLFGPTSIRSIDHKYYSLVVTDDFSRFTWVFFLGTKDETYGILKDFITFIENQLTKQVKAIRCDNGTEFKNSKLIELCGSKGIRRDYSNARTPQQNRVAERKNRTLIEAARTMLADSMLPTIHLKPFGCLVTILNTSDHLGKFEGKADEGFIVGYATHSKAYRVYNLSSKKIEDTRYTRFKTNQPAGTQDTNIHAGTKVNETSDMVESSSDYAEELARLHKQAYEANTITETHLSQADLATSRNRVPAGKVDSAASITDSPTDPSTPVVNPVHTAEPSLPPGHSLGSSEHSSRYPYPSDLANSMSSFLEIEDIYHHPDT